MKILKELRQSKGVSQQEVADYLEITRQAYGNYETGIRQPDNEILLKLGEYFGVSVDSILRGQGAKEESPKADGTVSALLQNLRDEDRALLEVAKDMTPEQVAMMTEFAKALRGK